MHKYLPLLENTALFSGVARNEIEKMALCLKIRSRQYQKGEYVFHSGEHINCIAILAHGALLVQKNDYWGNRSIINRICVGESFGETYALNTHKALLTDTIALENSTVLFIEIQRMLEVCSKVCKFHILLIKNLTQIIAEKNLVLTQKIDCMAQRSIRKKLVTYLSMQAKLHNSPRFDIPFNRQQLADYLSVDRSALSNELSKMHDEGLLTFSKNHFEFSEKELDS